MFCFVLLWSPGKGKRTLSFTLTQYPVRYIITLYRRPVWGDVNLFKNKLNLSPFTSFSPDGSHLTVFPNSANTKASLKTETFSIHKLIKQMVFPHFSFAFKVIKHLWMILISVIPKSVLLGSARKGNRHFHSHWRWRSSSLYRVSSFYFGWCQLI